MSITMLSVILKMYAAGGLIIQDLSELETLHPFPFFKKRGPF